MQAINGRSVVKKAILLTLASLLALGATSIAQQVYVTNEPGAVLEKVDLSTKQITVLPCTIGGRLDSLILNSLGQIIYTAPVLGQLGLCDPNTGSNTILASALSRPRDLVFDPSGTSLLVGLYTGGIVRMNLITGTITPLASKLGTVDGLAYDPAGDLFAVANHNTIVQIDPTTGKVLNTLVIEPHYKVNGGDGLVYDSYTGQLWGSHNSTTLGSGLMEISTDLASPPTFFQSGKIRVPDGIVSDGLGNLYIGNGTNVYVYNIPTDTIVKTVRVAGVDDVALIPGTF
jgi:streptogramin lyase